MMATLFIAEVVDAFVKFARINISDHDTIYRGSYDRILILAFYVFCRINIKSECTTVYRER